MNYGIRFQGNADGSPSKVYGLAEGDWLIAYSDTPCGRGHVEFSGDASKALKFTSAPVAFDFWRQRSQAVPTRPDGRPNRPLTAFTVAIEPLP